MCSAGGFVAFTGVVLAILANEQASLTPRARRVCERDARRGRWPAPGARICQPRRRRSPRQRTDLARRSSHRNVMASAAKCRRSHDAVHSPAAARSPSPHVVRRVVGGSGTWLRTFGPRAPSRPRTSPLNARPRSSQRVYETAARRTRRGAPMNPLFFCAVATNVAGTIRYKALEQRDRADHVRCFRRRITRVLQLPRRWIHSLPPSGRGGTR